MRGSDEGLIGPPSILAFSFGWTCRSFGIGARRCGRHGQTLRVLVGMEWSVGINWSATAFARFPSPRSWHQLEHQSIDGASRPLLSFRFPSTQRPTWFRVTILEILASTMSWFPVGSWPFITVQQTRPWQHVKRRYTAPGPSSLAGLAAYGQPSSFVVGRCLHVDNRCTQPVFFRGAVRPGASSVYSAPRENSVPRPAVCHRSSPVIGPPRPGGIRLAMRTASNRRCKASADLLKFSNTAQRTNFSPRRPRGLVSFFGVRGKRLRQGDLSVHHRRAFQVWVVCRGKAGRALKLPKTWP